MLEFKEDFNFVQSNKKFDKAACKKEYLYKEKLKEEAKIEELLELKEDFDFVENNKKFDKKFWENEYLWSQKLRMLCDGKTEEDFVCYDKNKSFFDKITCESTNPGG